MGRERGGQGALIASQHCVKLITPFEKRKKKRDGVVVVLPPALAPPLPGRGRRGPRPRRRLLQAAGDGCAKCGGGGPWEGRIRFFFRSHPYPFPPSDATCAGAPVEEAAFRGRRLLGEWWGGRGEREGDAPTQRRRHRPPPRPAPPPPGTTLPLPPGYAAFVLPPAPADPEPLPDSPSAAAAAAGPPPPRVWPASAAHASITYWLLDAHPAPTDGARRAVEWVGVAEAAAGHVGAGEVDERLTIVC